MERNWELIREILQTIEVAPTTSKPVDFGSIKGFEGETIPYHIQMLIEARLVEGDCSKSIGAPLHCWATRLTWHGHEFLDQIRSDTVWQKTKKILADKGVALSFDSIMMGVKAVVENLLG